MSLKTILLTAAIAGASQAAFASVYISDFSGASVGDALNGVDGWGQSEPNPSGDASPLAWVGTLGSTNAGVVGGYYDVPSGAGFYASRNIGVSLSSSSITFLFSIQDSTTNFASRNDFSFTVANGSGTNLFSVEFRAQSQFGDYDDETDPLDPATSNSNWNAHITSSVLGTLPAFAAVGEDATYALTLNFTGSGSDVLFDLNLSSGGGDVDESGTLTGLSAESFSQLRVGFDQGDGADWGDNFIAFQVVPEPSAAMLAALSGLGLLRRRRR